MPKLKLTKMQGFIILAVVVIIIGAYFLFRSSKTPPKPVSVSLSLWGTESPLAMGKLIEDYSALRPNVTVTYKQVTPDSYSGALLNALAAGNGPDVFMLGNHEIPKQLDKIVPVSSSTFSLLNLQQNFPQAVAQDVVVGRDIYSLPLYFDTLALIYNKDLFDQAGIVFPPKTWSDFQADVTQLTSKNSRGQIVRAGAAIGGSDKTIPTASDLLALLLLQNGAEMTDAGFSQARFATTNQGTQAFNFYVDFANPVSTHYTWNDNQDPALTSFVNSKVAMIFDYQSALASIKEKAPFLNVRIGAMPQVSPDAAVNYPSYQGLAVSKQSKNPGWAWDFIIYSASGAAPTKDFQSITGHPPALLSLVAQKKNDIDLTVFANQALTARSWYQADNDKIEKILSGAIAAVLQGQLDSARALTQAQEQVSAVIRDAHPVQ